MDDQIRRKLEQYYYQCSKPTKVQRDAIAEALGLTSKSVQNWFLGRREKAKADKIVEQAQAKTALANAHQIPSHETQQIPMSRSMNHSSQSQASYASLARSLTAAEKYLPSMDTAYDSMPPSPGAQMSMGSPSYAHSNFSFEQAPLSFSMSRSDSQFSNFSATPCDNYEQATEYPFSQPENYMPTHYATRTDMSVAPEFPADQYTPSSGRPVLQRTWTAPVQSPSRPIPRRTISTPYADSMSPSEPVRMKRRPKLSPLGVGMCRSRSSIGYDSSEQFPYPARRTPSHGEFPYPTPITPGRRTPISAAVSALAMTSSIPSGAVMSAHSPENTGPECTNDDYPFLQFPPSPISPDQAPAVHAQLKNISSLNLQNTTVSEDSFTPPPTPLSALTPSAENSLANTYVDNWSVEFDKLNGSSFLVEDDLLSMDIFGTQQPLEHTF